MAEHFTRIGDIISQIDNLKLRESKTGCFKFKVYLSDEISSTPIELLDLSTRSINSLKRANIHTIGDLCDRVSSRKELKNIRNCGVTSANEIMDHLFAYQYFSLKPEKREEYIADVISLNAG